MYSQSEKTIKYNLQQRTFIFSLEIIKLTKKLQNSYTDQTLGKQLLRSACSIGANIIEAQSAPSKKDFANFYNIALKSANESIYWLELLKRTMQYEAKIDKLLDELKQICKIIAKSLITMRGK